MRHAAHGRPQGRKLDRWQAAGQSIGNWKEELRYYTRWANVFVLLDSLNHDVVRALEIDVADVRATSNRVEWVSASRILVA